MEEKLIECVRNYEFLFNLQHPKYADSNRKDLAWKEISYQMQQPADICKHKWQALRDAFRRSLKKRKLKNNKRIKKWKFEDEMSFLAPYLTKKRSLQAFMFPSDDDEQVHLEGQEFEVELFEDKGDSIETAELNEGIVHNEEVNVGSTTVTAQKLRTTKNSKSDVMVTKLFEHQQHRREHDELDRFFLNISDTVKKFSPYLQAVAKQKIFSLVSEMELQLLSPTADPTTSAAVTVSVKNENSSSSIGTTSMDTWE